MHEVWVGNIMTPVQTKGALGCPLEEVIVRIVEVKYGIAYKTCVMYCDGSCGHYSFTTLNLSAFCCGVSIWRNCSNCSMDVQFSFLSLGSFFGE